MAEYLFYQIWPGLEYNPNYIKLESNPKCPKFCKNPIMQHSLGGVNMPMRYLNLVEG